MADISVQVREYFEYMVDHVEPEEVTRRRPSRPPKGLGTPGWLVAAAAAAVVLLLIGGVAWLLRIESVAPPAEEPAPTLVPQIVPTMAPPETEGSRNVPPTTATDTPPTEPVAKGEPAELKGTIPGDFMDGWTRPSLLESGLAGAQLERIFPWGDRLVGIGRDRETGQGTVWASYDGLHWEARGNVFIEISGEAAPSAPFPQLRWMNVKVGGPGLVAVDKPGSVGAEVWVAELSEAGLTWRHTASIPGACCFVDIAASDDVIVVVSEKVDHQDGNPGVWTSTDAYTWERVSPDSLPFADSVGGLGFVVDGGPGFVGIGWGVRAIYVSIDGTEWFSPQDFAETHPAAVHESHIALGHTSYGRICLGNANGGWTCGIGTSKPVTSLAALDGRYVSIRAGQFDAQTGEPVPAGNLLGLSTDGRTWTWLPATAETFLSAAPVDVVEWQGQIIVLTVSDTGGVISAWTPQRAE